MQSFGGLTSLPYTITRIDFQSPVSGTVTLRADFVLRDFDGVGNLRLPEFGALQSRITRSMLAVYADPLLELHFPTEGRSSGFEEGWQGTPVIPPFLRDVPFLEIAGPLFARQPEVSPDAEYDLNRTESDWTLNIRTKKMVPEVAVSQCVQLDTGESRVHVVGEFTVGSSIFQQHFSADRSIHIETLEVRDAQNLLVESRFQRIAPGIAPGIAPETSATHIAPGTIAEQEHYLVLFRRSVTGTYTMTIRGFFETDVREELLLQPVPLLTFGGVQTTEHSLNLFRTPAVIAEIPPEQRGWSMSNLFPSAPETFTQSIPLGTWRRAESTEMTLPEQTILPEPEPKPKSNALQFALSPNRPKVRCKTVLSLYVDSDDQWTMTLDHVVNVTDGELRSLLFRWDERCGVIQSVEPAASWSFEPSSGQQQTLAVSFNEPIRGEKHLRMVVSLNITGAASLPNVFPLARGADQFESEILVDLPLRQGHDTIPWDLNHLVEMEEQTANTQRLRFRAMDTTNFEATINWDEARLTALFYDIGFLVRHDGTITGVITIDLRNRGQDHFVLQMPPGYEPIQISTAELLLGRTRLAEGNRWRINIGTSDYPQRLSVLFRASLPTPLRQWNREQIVSTLQLPFLEGVAVQETIWSIAFEGNLPPLNVTSIQDRHWGITLSPDLLGNEESELGEHLLVSGADAARSLIGVNLIRKHNLIQVLQSMPISPRQDEMQRWFLHWLEEWNMVADKVDFQISHLPLTLHNVRPNLIARPSDPASEGGETIGIIRSFLELMSARTPEALRSNKEQTVLEKFGSAMDIPSKLPTPILTSQVYWQGRSAQELQYLFGTEEGALRAIRLTSVPSTGDWFLQLSEHLWLWVSLALLIPIFVLLSVRWVHWTELWLQFPHFWGMTLGVLLWTFLPESFLGPIIIALALLSFFRPSWNQNRFRSYA